MVNKLVRRQFTMSYNVKCTVGVPAPDLDADPNQAPGLGDSYSEKKENLDKFLTEIIFPQYTRAMRGGIDAFVRSKLPTKFVYQQKVVIAPLFIYDDDLLGFYNHIEDYIGLDSDSFSLGFSEGTGIFLYGHEVGHRIVFFRPRKKQEALSEVKNILMISDDKIAEEILCDAFGYLLNENGVTRFDTLPDITPIKREGLARVALKLAWSD